jgi:ArsR family transcriptional regulator
MELDQNQHFATMNKAMGHPARVAIVQILRQENTCLSGSLSERLPLAASTVSEHLRILADAGLIQGTIDGPRRCYCVDDSALAQWQQMVSEL